MSRFALILFDLDGTLVDSFGDIQDGIRAACDAIGVAATEALLKLATRGVPLEDFYRTAVGRPPLGEEFDRFVGAYRDWYLPGCVSTTRPYPGVADTLERLRGMTPRPILGVATTKRTETAGRVLEGTGLLPLVDVYSGSDGLRHKPDPAVLARVAELAGVPLARGLMVGDTDRDVGAARNAGIPVVGVSYGGFADEEMRGLGPDWVIARLSDLLDIVA